jgi:hypothetical protein
LAFCDRGCHKSAANYSKYAEKHASARPRYAQPKCEDQADHQANGKTSHAFRPTVDHQADRPSHREWKQ